MFYICNNFKNSYGKLSLITNHNNTLQLIKLSKHDIYPHFNNYLMKNSPTNILIHSGKLLVN